MAAEPPTSDPRVIAAFLDDVDLELDAARRSSRIRRIASRRFTSSKPVRSSSRRSG
jgi:hypothetical protein